MGYQAVSLHDTVMRMQKNRMSKVLQNYTHMDQGRGGGQWARDGNGGGEWEKGGAVGDVNKWSWRRQQLNIS